LNAEAVIKELELGGFKNEHLDALRVDIQRIRDDREGQPALGETGFNARYANVFDFDAEHEKTRLAKFSADLAKYLAPYLKEKRVNANANANAQG
jgi:hypothetical protein